MSAVDINAIPPERPADMPEQSLRLLASPAGVRAAHRCWPVEPLGLQTFRCLIALAVMATVALGIWLLSDRLDPNGFHAVEAALLLFYGLLLLWLSMNFWVCVAGVLARIVHRAWWTPPTANNAATRTAVVMPLYNENASDAFARLAAMMRSLEAAGSADAFDFFVLSDSTDPRRYLEEERAWLDTCRRLSARGRLFYRRRHSNTGRKPGNIAEFCRRWGHHYDYLVVLDADSLMCGETLVECVRRMNADPGLGLLQTWPRPIGGTTIFARAQQFAAAVTGPMMVHGMAVLAGRSGNYWGHNAIIRTRAFTQSCGLPNLSGRPPLGGDILSHDFVEAALLVRNGWGVRIDADLGGSYEQAPPNILENLRRDRRWCQGNLQHLRILMVRDLHPISRINLLIGIMSFLAGPIWLIFVTLAIAEAWRSTFAERLAQLSLEFPRNLGAVGAEQLSILLGNAPALALLGLTVVLLIGPKTIGLVATLLNRRQRRAQGGALRVVSGCLLETVLFALVAPMVMLAHSRFVAEVLSGYCVNWTTAQRDASHVTWAEAIRPLIWIPLTVMAAAAIGTTLVSETFWWLSPILLSAGLAIPLTVLTGRSGAGAAVFRLGLLGIPEETHPAKVVREHICWPRHRHSQIRDTSDLISVVRRPLWLQLHQALTPPTPASTEHVVRLEAVRRAAIDYGLESLSLDDWQVLLARPDVLVNLNDGVRM